jgi:ribosomal protein S15P/S13E
MTHNTTECRRFNKDSSQKDRLMKPFDSAKKPWNKPGSGDPDQITYLTEEIANLRGTVKRARESSDNDSDDNLDNGSSSTGLVDKRIKLVQPSGVQLKSTDTRPIKATKLALDTIRANEIAIKYSETGKVTAVMAILVVFGDNTHNSRNANPGKLMNSQHMNSFVYTNS